MTHDADRPTGTHDCLVYDDAGTQLAAVVARVREALTRGERCAYIADDRGVDEVAAAFATGGIDLDGTRRRGALFLLTKRSTFLYPGVFEPDRMLELLRRGHDDAVAAGFRGFSVLAEMTWALGAEPGCDRLAEYEARCAELVQARALRLICQYHRGRFAPARLRRGLETHPNVIVDGRRYHNPFFRALIGPAPEAAEAQQVDWMLQRVRDAAAPAADGDSEPVAPLPREAVARVAGDIAHDFNNTLTAILASIESAKMALAPDSPERARVVAAEQEALRARRLAQRLLALGRVADPVRREVAVAGLLRLGVEDALAGRSVAAQFDLAPDLWSVDADPDHLSAAIFELVLHASEGLPPGSRIDLAASNVALALPNPHGLPPGQYVRIVLPGRAGGGAPEPPRSLDPFAAPPPGGGLGRVAADETVRRHGGRIVVAAPPIAGAAVVVFLPATDGSPPAEVRARTPFAGRARVLFMDDQAPIRRLVTEGLVREGFEVDCCADGAEAVERFRAARSAGRSYHVVVLDLMVPDGMGGREAVAALRRLDPEVRAIVASGYSNDPVLADYRAFGFASAVPKPYQPRELATALRRILAEPPTGAAAG